MVENIHRAGMRETEIVAGVEQLALLGVSAAQIAKRTAIDRADRQRRPGGHQGRPDPQPAGRPAT